MAVGVKWLGTGILVVIIGICLAFILNEDILVYRMHPSKYPKPTQHYWGKDPSAKGNDDTQIHPFTPFNNQAKNEQILSQFIDLWLDYEESNPSQHETIINTLNNINYNELSKNEGRGYGINYNDMHDLVTYYKDSFDWNKYKNMIQTQFNHFVTNIHGLNIHFIRHKLNQNKPSKSGIEAVLFFHGWPSSFYEYTKLSKVFEANYKAHAIDIIIPSLPGYGFSDYPMGQSGFDTAAIGEIFRDLMEKRLDYNSYIVVGGDWGGGIAHNMAYSVVCNVESEQQQKLKGLLLTMPLSMPAFHELFLLSLDMPFLHQHIAKKYNVPVEMIRKRFSPFYDKFIYQFWDLIGYQHEHATRSNTIGIALQSSPVSHLAWIYEKYLGWSDSHHQVKYDGKKRVISGGLSWDDVLVTNNIFWLNGKVSSAIRYYTESRWKMYQYAPMIYIPEEIAIGTVHFENDAFHLGPFDRWNYRNLVLQRFHDKGGHFPALEYPELLYEDVIEFIDVLEKDL